MVVLKVRTQARLVAGGEWGFVCEDFGFDDGDNNQARPGRSRHSDAPDYILYGSIIMD